MPLHPLLPRHPFVITDLPTTEKALCDFLWLLGDLNTWNPIAISAVLRTNTLRDLILADDRSTFMRTTYRALPDHTRYTAAEITRMLTSPHLYRRPNATQSKAT